MQSFNIFGGKYARASPVPAKVEIVLNQSTSLTVEKVKGQMIYNDLDIRLRLKDASLYDWVSILDQAG